ncbi:MAG: hypothetical protein A3C47_03720 [Omnitrophica bacterium RIFCSPHIGHO2_02_FULL_51_18]|nr:MAG: hypothetical protein A3C47_03720 [Omnitrophica bacterium RIFCSPHIGHO2_02_FULL_51_18]
MKNGNEGQSTVLWWIGWILLTILSFFVSCYFWTGFIAKNVGGMDKPGVPVLWVTAVFGSWMVLLVPLIVLMYSKVDKAYEDARIARETAALDKAKTAFRVRSVFVEPKKRILTKALSQKLKQFPETLKKAHLVTATLKNGRRVENVFVVYRREVLGVYDRDSLDFEIKDIADLERADLGRLPDFKSEKWLRLDGIGAY